MQFFVKLLVSMVIILAATAVGRKAPALAGLLAVMPLTGVLVLVWLYVEQRGDRAVMQEFTRGALWGVVPSMLFFLAAFVCFKKNLPLSVVLPASFAVWFAGAMLHQWLLK
jgi:uncharacterized membrane protein (GlpM family)